MRNEKTKNIIEGLQLLHKTVQIVRVVMIIYFIYIYIQEVFENMSFSILSKWNVNSIVEWNDFALGLKGHCGLAGQYSCCSNKMPCKASHGVFCTGSQSVFDLR